MATTPYLVFGPNTILSLIGFLSSRGEKHAPPKINWHDVTVDVVIPAYNEESTIVLCLESLTRQTLKPNRVILIDDGSKDRTASIAREFAEKTDLPLEVIFHRKSVGKTPGVKQEARELDGDVEFVLDGDTILESPNYLERVVQELYNGNSIGSACGIVRPLSDKDRHLAAKSAAVQDFYRDRPDLSYIHDRSFFHHLMREITNVYRDFLYYFLQNFIYRGYMSLFGSIINPVGCAVAYRREYLKDIFDAYEDVLGDDLTTSEDIFIGFAFQERGFRNVQAHDVYALSEEPEAQSVPQQIFLWSSSFLQSCYYFTDLLTSPFKFLKRRKHSVKQDLLEHQDQGKTEPYPRAWSIEYTQKYGRPIGWVILLSLFEKIVFPLAVILMLAFGWWETLIITLVSETTVLLLITYFISHTGGLKYAGKALLATPMRYAALMFEVITISRFLFDILLFRTHQWRK